MISQDAMYQHVQIKFADGTEITMFISNLHIEHSFVDTTTLGSSTMSYMVHGPQKISIDGVCVGPITKGSPLELSPETEALVVAAKRSISFGEI